MKKKIPRTGIEPARPKTPEPKSGASTNSAISAFSSGGKLTNPDKFATLICIYLHLRGLLETSDVDAEK